MQREKSISGIAAWVLYTIASGALIVYSMYHYFMAKDYGSLQSELYTFGCLFLGFMLFIMIDFAIRSVIPCISEKVKKKTSLFYTILFLLLFMGAIAIRIVHLVNGNWKLRGDLSLYNSAFVTETAGNTVSFLEKPFEFIHYEILHFLMRVFGNSESTIVYFYLGIQVITLLLLFLVVKRTIGKAASLWILLFYGFAFTIIDELTNLSTVQLKIMFILLLAFVITLVFEKLKWVLLSVLLLGVLSTYSILEWSSVTFTVGNLVLNFRQYEILAIVVLLIAGMVTMFQRKFLDIVFPFTTAALIYLLNIMNLLPKEDYMLLTLSIFVLAAASMASLFPQKETIHTTEKIPEKLEAPEKVEVLVTVEKEDKEDVKPTSNLIDNPLPVPKRHVRKENVDYQIEVPDEKMCFDYEIDDNTDYDI